MWLDLILNPLPINSINRDSITVYHEKSPYQAKATKSSKPFFSLFRPTEASRLIYFLIYAIAR